MFGCTTFRYHILLLPSAATASPSTHISATAERWQCSNPDNYATYAFATYKTADNATGIFDMQEIQQTLSTNPNLRFNGSICSTADAKRDIRICVLPHRNPTLHRRPNHCVWVEQNAFWASNSLLAQLAKISEAITYTRRSALTMQLLTKQKSGILFCITTFISNGTRVDFCERATASGTREAKKKRCMRLNIQFRFRAQ